MIVTNYTRHHHGPIRLSVDQDTMMGKVINILEEVCRTQGNLILEGDRILGAQRVRDLQMEAGDGLNWHGVMRGD